MGIHITDIEKKIARQIFEKLAEMPIGTRTYTAELASSFGVSEFDDKGPDIWNIDTHLRAVVREDGRFILDDSHHAGRCEGFPYNLDFILLRNNMQQYDKVANDFAIANGHKGAYFYEYWKGFCRYTELENEELDEGEKKLKEGEAELEEGKKKLPGDSVSRLIEGGNHTGFGDYGVQAVDGEATITHEEQQRIAVEEVEKMLAK